MALRQRRFWPRGHWMNLLMMPPTSTPMQTKLFDSTATSTTLAFDQIRWTNRSQILDHHFTTHYDAACHRTFTQTMRQITSALNTALLELPFFVAANTRLDQFDLRSRRCQLAYYTRLQHFGGLWETRIKSAKQHFKRQIASFLCKKRKTVMVQIEAVKLRALTAVHFLIGALRCQRSTRWLHTNKSSTTLAQNPLDSP